MSDGCIFCRIVKGDIPAQTVYEDLGAVAFLDVNPLAPGHTLVIPKTHAERIEDLDPEDAAALFRALHTLVGPVQEAVDADAATVAFNNGPAAGQEVPHVHGHIVPRFEGDSGGPIHAVIREPPEVTEAERADIAERIRQNIA